MYYTDFYEIKINKRIGMFICNVRKNDHLKEDLVIEISDKEPFVCRDSEVNEDVNETSNNTNNSLKDDVKTDKQLDNIIQEVRDNEKVNEIECTVSTNESLVVEKSYLSKDEEKEVVEASMSANELLFVKENQTNDIVNEVVEVNISSNENSVDEIYLSNYDSQEKDESSKIDVAEKLIESISERKEDLEKVLKE
ncbi:hypothetical protein A0H76_1403 [Hepatospora eriocheir]|uniref:Uncharacterized protein n=1 Tax=Hepatospora eriocheir TaxID=1081669 RepID=A0A1X0Q5V4_9MICR|nr:hypothetical protein A0H76_1403 [Hepatospora eriocheir]